MKAEELKTKTQDELKKALLDLRKQQFNLRFQQSNGAVNNTSEFRKTRRAIARVKTFLNASATEAKAAPKKAAEKKTTTKKAAGKAA